MYRCYTLTEKSRKFRSISWKLSSFTFTVLAILVDVYPFGRSICFVCLFFCVPFCSIFLFASVADIARSVFFVVVNCCRDDIERDGSKYNASRKSTHKAHGSHLKAIARNSKRIRTWTKKNIVTVSQTNSA